MGNRNATTYIDYQQRAAEFKVGDMVFPVGASVNDALGRVVAVYPAIGQLDIEWPAGAKRMPVEDVQRVQKELGVAPEKDHSSVPGDPGSVAVSTGPEQARKATRGQLFISAGRVSNAFVKRALYWAAKNRHYKATKAECESGRYLCPRCKDVVLRPAPYERSDGVSVDLLGCTGCLFLIKPCDIIGHPDYIDDEAPPELLASGTVG